jgi:replicative DNA helicase
MNRAQKPLWINEKTQPGRIEIDGKIYNIGAYQYPQDEESEMNTLGCVLQAGEAGQGNNAFKRLSFMRYDDYYYMRHAIIYRAMVHVFARGDEIDLQSVKAELTAIKRLDTVGGEAYLIQLASRNAVNLESYARAVVRAALGRAIIVAGDVLKDMGGKVLATNLDDLINLLPRAIRDILVRLQTLSEQNTTSLYDALEVFGARLEDELNDDNFEPGIPSGFTNQDKVTLGWRKKKLYAFAAPSGWGKTALLLNWALAALLRGKRLLFITLEMPVEELIERIVAIKARVNYLRLQQRRLSKVERERVAQAMAELSQAITSKAFMIVHLKQPTMQRIETKLIELQFNPGYDLVFIDYIAANTLSGDDMQIDAADEFRLTSHAYKELDRWKTDYDIPLIITTQMNGNWDKRKGKRPGPRDMYYGAAGYFAADVIGFLYHPSLAKGESPDGDAELIYRKNRSGPVGDDYTAMMTWEPEYLTFTAADENPHGMENEDDDNG